MSPRHYKKKQTMIDKTQIPEGYKADSKGRLIPVESIKQIDLARDELIEEIVGKARHASEILAQFREGAFDDIEAFVELSAEKYDAKLGGAKGNLTLTSFDGRYRIKREISDHLEFDERLMAAKKLIDECIEEWSGEARKEVKTLINQAFQVQAGRINTKRVLELRRLNFEDHRWARAMAAISDSVLVTSSKTYLRIYERIGESDQYRPISLGLTS